MNKQMLVHSEMLGPVLRLTLDDEATRNSLSEDMMQQLAGQLRNASGADNIHVIILAAKGKVFSSGHNLKQLTAHRSDPDKGLAYFEKTFALCSDLMMAIIHHRCPVIAEVDGLASAAGCQLIASCDLAYASPDAGFCTPGVNIGLFCSTPMVPLSRNVSSKHAMEMLLTGDIKDAKFAERIGLINAIVPKDQLSPQVTELAQRIAKKSQAAISYGKRTFYDQSTLPLSEAYALASSVMVKNMLDGAACEGLDAFINKREAQWPKTIK
jgi:enoyl-CoA hydratase/carnithine racemase